MKKKGSFKMGVGISSLLLIFVVLCLTTFSVLSYQTANADHKLTAKTGETIADYYKADAEAEKIVADIDAALKERGDAAKKIAAAGSLEGVDPALLLGQEEAIQKALAYNDAEKQVYQILIAAWAQEKGFSFAKDEMTLRFSVPCLSEQILSVELKVAKTPGEAVRYELTAHTLEQPAGATDDEPLDVWQGNIRMLWG